MLNADGTVRAFGDLVAGDEPRRRDPLLRRITRRARAVAGEDIFPTCGLSKFVELLSGHEGPVVVDLGAAVGLNVTFLGDQLGCKLHVEDLLSDQKTWGPLSEDDDGAATDGSVPSPARRLQRPTGGVDGVLVWDVLDYLDESAAWTLAAEITRVLSPGGAVFVSHQAELCRIERPVHYEIIDPMTLRYRASERVLPPPRVWQCRAITQMFTELSINSSYLLTNRMREIVFRKPPAPTATD